jgi:hypothetical protein
MNRQVVARGMGLAIFVLGGRSSKGLAIVASTRMSSEVGLNETSG